MYTLLFGCFSIRSSYIIFQEKLSKFKNCLLQNGYPEQFIDHCFRIFLNKIFDLPLKSLTAPKLQISVVSPITFEFVVISIPAHISLRLAFQPVCRISNLFRFKYLMWYTNLCANAVLHCISAKHAEIYTHRS